MNYMCNYCLENTASLPLLDPSPSMLLVYKSLHYQTGHLNFVVAPCVLTVACRKSVLEQWIAVNSSQETMHFEQHTQLRYGLGCFFSVGLARDA
jgi:hypothetical protein